MEFITIIGLSATVITTISLFPQLLRILKTKSTKDISMIMYSVFCVGVFLWLVYGVLLDDLPIMIANTLAFTQGVVILLLKLRYK